MGDQARRRKTEVRPVAFHKQRAPAIEPDAAGVGARHARKTKGIQPGGPRIETPEASPVAPGNAPRRFDVRKGMETLAEIQETAGVENEVADILMRIAGAESRQDEPALVGFVVAVGIA